MSDLQDAHSSQMSRSIFWVALAFSSFQLVTAAFSPLSSQVVRAVHVGFLLLLGFALIAALKTENKTLKAWFWALGLIGFGTGTRWR